jgi:hypothetical protein
MTPTTERRDPFPKSHNILTNFRDDAAQDSASGSDDEYSNSEEESDRDE